MIDESWLLAGSTKDAPSVTAAWEPLAFDFIEGVVAREIKHVVTSNGVMTEVYRKDWGLEPGDCEHVFARTIFPGKVSAWHAHGLTTDRLFVLQGYARIALYDSRPDSPTCGKLNEFRVSGLRPTLLIVPPKVWHAVQNIGPETITVLNAVSRAYVYDDPDHWRLPENSPSIPFQF